MRIDHINDMKKGWFVGNFVPTVLETDACEVAIKHYKKGEQEGKHYHLIATELTAVVSGKIRMFGKVFREGDIIVVEPGEATSFEALEDTVNVVVKIPGVNNDKYLVEEDNK